MSPSRAGSSHSSSRRIFSSAKIFFENDGIRKKNATDELYSSSKWPFEQADMNINWILVYWDDGNSLPNILVIPFKDGVTFVVMTAIQSLQWCNLESVADVKFVTVTKCHFWSKFSKWPLRTAIKLISCIFFPNSVVFKKDFGIGKPSTVPTVHFS